MVFSTIIFLFRFLPITLALYYLAPAKLKNTVLFLCSLVFYCWGEVRFFPVMLALILINYLCGLAIERFDAKPARAHSAAGGAGGQLRDAVLLQVRKLCAAQHQCPAGHRFCGHSGHRHPAAGHQLLHLPDPFLLHRRLPPGCKNRAQHHDFGAYVVMFPQLIAGPIVKYRDVSDQLHVYKHRYNLKQIEDGMTLFTFGLAKRCCWRTPSARSGRTSSA